MTDVGVCGWQILLLQTEGIELPVPRHGVDRAAGNNRVAGKVIEAVELAREQLFSVFRVECIQNRVGLA